MSPIETIVRNAGGILREGFLGEQRFTEKARRHLLSEYDVKSHDLIVDSIRELYPEDSIASEEGILEVADATSRWLVDPMDGSACFIFGEPYFSVCLARETDGCVTEAHVFNPVTDEYYYTDASLGASLLNGSPIGVSSVRVLDEALVAFGFSANYPAIERYYNDWHEVFERCRKGLAWICPALSICNVARGRIEAFIDYGCSIEGQAAASLILRNAGGHASNYSAPGYDHRVKGGVFTNGRLELPGRHE